MPEVNPVINSVVNFVIQATELLSISCEEESALIKAYLFV